MEDDFAFAYNLQYGTWEDDLDRSAGNEMFPAPPAAVPVEAPQPAVTEPAAPVERKRKRAASVPAKPRAAKKSRTVAPLDISNEETLAVALPMFERVVAVSEDNGFMTLVDDMLRLILLEASAPVAESSDRSALALRSTKAICMQVCKKWRAVLRADAGLWNTVSVDVTFHYACLPSEVAEATRQYERYLAEARTAGATHIELSAVAKPSDHADNGHLAVTFYDAAKASVGTFVMENTVTLSQTRRSATLDGSDVNALVRLLTDPLFKGLVLLAPGRIPVATVKIGEEVVAASLESSILLSGTHLDAFVASNAGRALAKEDYLALFLYGHLAAHSNERIIRAMMKNSKTGLFVGAYPSRPIYPAQPTYAPPAIAAPGVALHSYQEDLGAWMIYQERLIREGGLGGAHFDMIRRQRLMGGGSATMLARQWVDWFKRTSIDDQMAMPAPALYDTRIHYQGGFIADGVGLGKTIAVLAHAMQQRPAMPTSLRSQQLPWFVEGYARMDASEAVDDEEEEEEEEGKKEKDKKEEKEEDGKGRPANLPMPRHPSKYPRAPLFNARGTLIIVPNQLPGQWCGEIAKLFGNRVRVVVITTIVDHARVTYRDVMEADFVVVSWNFVATNTKYHKLLSPQHSAQAWSERQGAISSLLASVKDDAAETSWLARTSPILELFAWARVYYDEGHEMFKTTAFLRVMHNFTVGASWYISATPFPSMTIYGYALTLLRITMTARDSNDDYDDNDHKWTFSHHLRVIDLRDGDYQFEAKHEDTHGMARHISNEILHQADEFIRAQAVVGRLLWRHTQGSIQDEMQVPNARHLMVRLDFSPEERALYAAYDHVKARDMCIALASFPSVTRNNYNMTDIGDCIDLLRQFQHRTADILDPPGDAYYRTHAQDIGSCLPLVTSHAHTFTDFVHMATTLQDRALRRDNEADDTEGAIRRRLNETAIPGATEDSVMPGMVPLPYPFRDALIGCIKRREALRHEAAENRAECVRYTDALAAFLASEPVDPLALLRDPSKTWMYLGTKLGALFAYLTALVQNDPTARVLLFAHSKRLLDVVSFVLNRSRIGNTSVTGSVHCRSKALRTFKSSASDTRVMLFNLGEAASGMHLVEASHVILLDAPPLDVRAAAIANECQAIGRAVRQGQDKKVAVLRFMVADTIDEVEAHRSASAYSKNATTVRLDDLLSELDDASLLAGASAMDISD